MGCGVGVCALLEDFAEHVEDMAGTGCRETFASRGHGKAVEEVCCVADIAAWWWCWSARLLTQDVHSHILNRSLDSIQACSLALGMRITDHAIDLSFVVFEEWVDVLFVDEDAALLAGQDEVEVDAEADPAVEGNPGEDEVELRLNG